MQKRANETLWKVSNRLTVCVPLSLLSALSVQTDLQPGVTAALMKVQRSSEPDLAAQHRALRFSAERTGTELSQSRANAAGSAPLSCEDTASVHAVLFYRLLQSTEN